MFSDRKCHEKKDREMERERVMRRSGMLFFRGWSEKALLLRDKSHRKRECELWETWRMSALYEGKMKCKGPEIGACLRNSRCGWDGVSVG